MKSNFTTTSGIRCLFIILYSVALVHPLHLLADKMADSPNPSIYGPVYPSVDLEVNDFNQIGNPDVEVIFHMHDVSNLRFLRIHPDPVDKYGKLIMGYDDKEVYGDFYELPEGTQYLEIRVRPQWNTPWSKVKVTINETATVTIGDYPLIPINPNTTWRKVTIPLSDFGDIDAVQNISFSKAPKVQFDMDQIKFTGGEREFIWFGVNKFDNAIKANFTYQVVTDVTLPDPEEIQLLILNQGKKIVDTVMPFYSIKASLSTGENILVGVLTTEFGTVYSDTLRYTVSTGIAGQVQHASCYGSADGMINVSVEGGSPPYTYSWSNGASTQSITGLAAGLYSIIVTDAMGKADSAAFRIEQPNMLTAKLMAGGCDDTGPTLSASGGRAPYQYSVDGGEFISIGNSGNEDVWRLDIDNTGQLNYLYSFVRNLEADRADNLFILGEYSGLLVFGSDSASIGEEGKIGQYVVKLNADGTYAWGFETEEAAGQYYGSKSIDIAVDTYGNSTSILEVTTNPVTIKSENITLAPGAYLVHLNANGGLEWIKEFEPGLNNVSVDPFNNIYLIGKQRSPSPTETGATDLVMMKYDSSGALLWQKHIRGRNYEINRDMFIDDSGNIYITGAFSGDINFDGLQLNSIGREDAYVAKFNSDGQILWAKSGGTANGFDTGWSVVADGAGNLFAPIILHGANGSFGDFQITKSEQVLLRLNAQDGSIIWGRSYFRGSTFSQDAFEVEIVDDRIYLTALGYGLILREGEAFDPSLSGNLLFGFDYSGQLMSLRKIGQSKYSDSESTWMAATEDNHLVFTNFINGFSIIKHGAPMKQTIDITSDYQEITIKDANDCLFLLDDLSYEEPSVLPPTICYVTSGTSGNKLFWTPSGEGEPAESYNIYRETFATDEFELIGSVDKNIFAFEDTVNVLERSYRYVLTSTDACGNESEMSWPHQTMHLTVNQGNVGQINLIWDRYEGFDYNSFQIYRGSSPEDMELLTQLPSYLFTYTDMDPSPTTLYYQIVVENAENCGESTFSDTGRQYAEDKKGRVVTSNIASRFGKAENLAFFPNPGIEDIHVKFNPDGNLHQLRVIDGNGRIVKTIDQVFDRAVIKRENLPAGIYQIILDNKSGKYLHGRIAFK